MIHVSANFDRTGFQMDWNVVFPMERLRELVSSRSIGSLAALKLLDLEAGPVLESFPGDIHSLALALRLASQDLRTFYFEAALARPGTRSPGGSGFGR